MRARERGAALGARVPPRGRRARAALSGARAHVWRRYSMNDGMKYCWPPVCRMSAHTWVTSPPQICVIAAWRAARFAWSLMMGSRCAAHVGTRVTVFVGWACS